MQSLLRRFESFADSAQVSLCVLAAPQLEFYEGFLNDVLAIDDRSKAVQLLCCIPAMPVTFPMLALGYGRELSKGIRKALS